MRDIRLLATAISLLVVIILAVVLWFFVRGLRMHPEQRARAQKAVRYSLGGVALALLIVIWAEELRSAALVLSAFAVAIVIAGKEICTCFLGWWLKLAGGHYRIGDRIEVGPFKGDVVDYGLLTTTLLEVESDPRSEQRSGSVITLPNSMLFAEAVRNETRAYSFHWHTVTVGVPAGQSWQTAESALLEAGQQEWARFSEDAGKQEESAEKRFAVEPLSGEPRVHVTQRDDDRISLELRIGLPVRDARSVEDRILRTYLASTETTAPAVG